MTKKLGILLLLALCLSVLFLSTVLADTVDSGSCGNNVTWTLDDSGLLTISGTGAMDDFDWEGSPWHDSCDSITTLQIENGVASVGSCAFFGCVGLDSVTFPSSVTSIGDFAFFSCVGLNSVTFQDGIVNIGFSAFDGCTGLTSVTIPASVTSIDSYAFCACASLTNIVVDSRNENYASEDGVLFNQDKSILITYPGGKTGAYTLPDSVANISFYAFCNCAGLTNVTIPASVSDAGL